jgi:protein gp37
MAAYTNIQWTDATINFWEGCRKVSEGCKFCYMFRDMERRGKDPNAVRKVSEKYILKILKKLNEKEDIHQLKF